MLANVLNCFVDGLNIPQCFRISLSCHAIRFARVYRETEWRMGVWFSPWKLIREHHHNIQVMGLFELYASRLSGVIEILVEDPVLQYWLYYWWCFIAFLLLTVIINITKCNITKYTLWIKLISLLFIYFSFLRVGGDGGWLWKA